MIRLDHMEDHRNPGLEEVWIFIKSNHFEYSLPQQGQVLARLTPVRERTCNFISTYFWLSKFLFIMKFPSLVWVLPPRKPVFKMAPSNAHLLVVIALHGSCPHDTRVAVWPRTNGKGDGMSLLRWSYKRMQLLFWVLSSSFTCACLLVLFPCCWGS